MGTFKNQDLRTSALCWCVKLELPYSVLKTEKARETEKSVTSHGCIREMRYQGKMSPDPDRQAKICLPGIISEDSKVAGYKGNV